MAVGFKKNPQGFSWLMLNNRLSQIKDWLENLTMQNVGYTISDYIVNNSCCQVSKIMSWSLQREEGLATDSSPGLEKWSTFSSALIF
jgi:hypothetical protein